MKSASDELHLPSPQPVHLDGAVIEHHSVVPWSPVSRRRVGSVFYDRAPSATTAAMDPVPGEAKPLADFERRHPSTSVTVTVTRLSFMCGTLVWP